MLRLCLLAAGLQQLCHLRHALLHRLEIGKAELRLNDVDVAQRVDRPLHMGDVCTLKAADNVRHGIHLTDVLKELVAQPLALRCALHKTRDIDKANTRRGRLLGMVEIGQHLETRIRHRHHAHIRLNRAERIVRRLCTRLCNRIEQRALAHIRQPHNSNLKIAHDDSLFHRPTSCYILSIK